MREAWEETGLANLELIRCLGTIERDMREFGVSEVQEAWFFHLQCPGDPPLTWQHDETSDSMNCPIRFEFFWADLPDGVPHLIALNGVMLDALNGGMNPPRS